MRPPIGHEFTCDLMGWPNQDKGLIMCHHLQAIDIVLRRTRHKDSKETCQLSPHIRRQKLTDRHKICLLSSIFAE